MSELNLKPCPFCGGTNISIEAYSVQPDNFHSAYVECADCEARGPNALTVDGWLPSKEEACAEAIAAWNRRATQPASAPAELKPYTYGPNRCDCHPETCSCNPWAIYRPDGVLMSTAFDEGRAKRLVETLNRDTGRTAAVSAPSDTLNVLLWLYRRLPRCYGRPPHIEQPIKALAKAAGTDVSDFLAERGSDDSRETGNAAVGAPQGQAEPVAGDFVLVPRVPTEAMIQAACLNQVIGKRYANYHEWWNDHSTGVSGRIRDSADSDYRAMIAAAPAQPTQAVERDAAGEQRSLILGQAVAIHLGKWPVEAGPRLYLNGYFFTKTEFENRAAIASMTKETK